MTAVDTRLDRARIPPAVVVAIGLAWAAALAAHAGGYRHLLDHDAVLGENGSVPAALAYTGVWIVMVAAMMLPSAIPLVRLFVATGAQQPHPQVVLGLFVGGYLAVWTAFGGLAVLFDSAIHRGVEAWPLLHDHPSLLISGVLVLAGGFQFSSLKDRCLHACRHPAAYLLVHYRRGPAAAWRLGWGHGLFCLGCCWALMLLAFAAGMTDLRLMAGFTALMAYEKVGRRGETVARIAGLALLALGGVWLAAAMFPSP